MMQNIVLCGFMGCGKSTVGRLLASKTGRHFIDLDSLIEQREQRTVAQIFEQDGEDYFRKVETNCLQELYQKSNVVLATGGGTLIKEENAALIKQMGKLVFLNPPFETLAKRIENDPRRPLSGDDRLRERYESRLPQYKKAADCTVEGNKSPHDIVLLILSELRNL